MLTLADHISLMKHALGKTPDSRHNLYETFNRAGRALTNAHAWSWRNRTANVAATASQAYITVPSDVGTVRSAYLSSMTGSYSKVCLTTIEDILRMRQDNGSGFTGGGDFFMSWESWVDQAATTSQIIKRFQVFPTPTANNEPTVTIAYQAVWTEFPTDGTGGTRLPNIDLQFEHALILMARAFSVHIENQQAALEDAAVVAEIERLKMLDGPRQWDIGPMTGGAAQRLRRTDIGPRWANASV